MWLQVLTDQDWTDTDRFLAVSIASLPTKNPESSGQPSPNPNESEMPVVIVTEEPAESLSVPDENPEESAEESEQTPEETAGEPGVYSEEQWPETMPDEPEEPETEALPEEEGPETSAAEPEEPEAEPKEPEAEAEEPAEKPEEIPEAGTEPEAEQVPEDGEPEEQLPTDGEPGEQISVETGDGETADGQPDGENPAEPGPAQIPEQAEEAAPEATETPKLTAKACEEADPSLITTAVIYNGNKKASEYNRAKSEQITMPVGGEYTRRPMGVLTFRGDAFRRNAACGTVPGATGLELAWTADTGSIKGASQTYYGIGWVGQPAIVKWSKEVRELSDILDSKKEQSGLKEVIAAGLDGTIYFLDLKDGTPTRSTIRVGYPMKGSPSVHPGGAPYMNVGQFARKMAKGTGRIGLRQYNLYKSKEMNLIDGLDGSNRRPFNGVGSFETSALMDRTSDTLITAGTNGILYVIHMGSTFDYQMGNYTQSPGTVMLKTKAKGETDADTAVEASVAMYDKYVFYADMGGILRCVDTNTMKTVWAVNTGDSVESTVALDFNSSGGLDLYTANLLSKRKKGDAQIRCLDAMSGEVKWTAEFEVKKDAKNKTVSGFRASPVVGEHDLGSLVYYTVNGLSEEGAAALGLQDATAALIVLDKRTGNKIWAKPLNGTAYSSPVAVYDESGYGWIIQCCGDGSILLMDGMTGRTVSELTVKGAIEGSPAVYNDMMVVGTTEKGENHIYGIRILDE